MASSSNNLTSHPSLSELDFIEVGRVKGSWKGIYNPTVHDDSSELTYHVVTTKEFDKDNTEVNTLYLIPLTWFDQTKNCYLYPPSSLTPGGMKPKCWTNRTFVKYDTPEEDWTEYDCLNIETDKPVEHLNGRRIIANIKSGKSKEEWTDIENDLLGLRKRRKRGNGNPASHKPPKKQKSNGPEGDKEKVVEEEPSKKSSEAEGFTPVVATQNTVEEQAVLTKTAEEQALRDNAVKEQNARDQAAKDQTIHRQSKEMTAEEHDVREKTDAVKAINQEAAVSNAFSEEAAVLKARALFASKNPALTDYGSYTSNIADHFTDPPNSDWSESSGPPPPTAKQIHPSILDEEPWEKNPLGGNELLLDLDQVNVIPSQRSTASPALITNPSGLAMNHSSLDHQFVRRNLQRQINSFAMMNPQQNRHDLSTSYFNPSEQSGSALGTFLCDAIQKAVQIAVPAAVEAAVTSCLEPVIQKLNSAVIEALNAISTAAKSDNVGKTILDHHMAFVKQHIPNLPCESPMTVIALDTALKDIYLSVSLTCSLIHKFRSCRSNRDFTISAYGDLVSNETSKNMQWRACGTKKDKRQGTSCLLNFVAVIGAALNMWVFNRSKDGINPPTTKEFVDYMQAGQKEGRSAYCRDAGISSEEAQLDAPDSITNSTGYSLRKEDFSIPELESRIEEVVSAVKVFKLPN